MTIHQLLDMEYGPDGAIHLNDAIDSGADVDEIDENGEAPIHVAVRRRRLDAVAILLERGADIDIKNKHGKTSYTHAIRRGFNEVTNFLASNGANTELNEADRFAVAVVNGNLSEAREVLTLNPDVARTGNPDEDRLLADVAGRNPSEPVRFLIEAGADLTAPALDSGTPLHQAAWFGQRENARLLIAAGAPLDVFEDTHKSSPLHWAVHGSTYSGGAEGRQDVYLELVEMLLAAGSRLVYPDGGNRYQERLLADASPRVRPLIEKALGKL